MKVVTKKILPEYFELILSGKRKFELRVADFDLEEGDVLRLEEWDSADAGRKPTGRYLEKKVTYLRRVDVQAWLEEDPELASSGFYAIQFD